MFKEDDKEVKEIIGRVISYFIRMSFDDVTLATQETIGAAQSFNEHLNQMSINLKDIIGDSTGEEAKKKIIKWTQSLPYGYYKSIYKVEEFNRGINCSDGQNLRHEYIKKRAIKKVLEEIKYD